MPLICMKCGNPPVSALNCSKCNQLTGSCDICGNEWECWCEIRKIRLKGWSSSSVFSSSAFTLLHKFFLERKIHVNIGLDDQRMARAKCNNLTIYGIIVVVGVVNVAEGFCVSSNYVCGIKKEKAIAIIVSRYSVCSECLLIIARIVTLSALQF